MREEGRKAARIRKRRKKENSGKGRKGQLK